LRYDDGTSLYFRNAFFIVDRDLNEIAVFTEHFGHHIFPLFCAVVELVTVLERDSDSS